MQEINNENLNIENNGMLKYRKKVSCNASNVQTTNNQQKVL